MWVHIPKQDFSTPLTVGHAVRWALGDLQRNGYSGETVFVGGHSLGGAFLPSVLDVVREVDGLVHLGCIMARSTDADAALTETVNLPILTVCGDLDGLVRTSRIAEDYYRNVEVIGNRREQKLKHAVVLVPGMNHFGVVEGEATFMDDFRDLEAEISTKESVYQVASTIAQFVAHHRDGNSDAADNLLAKIDRTHKYIRPLIEAMHLEGSYHIDTPCHLCAEDGDHECEQNCVEGSPWAAKVQLDISPDGEYGQVRDEFHQSWWINPFSDPPFYHPTVNKEGDRLEMKTVSEPVYEKSDFYLFDAGFFSNAALEIRSKFNSPQSILKARGVDVKFEANEGACSKMNEKTIQWAFENAPEVVRKRYQRRGVKLAAGKDIQHNSGTIRIGCVDYVVEKSHRLLCRSVVDMVVLGVSAS